MFLYIRNINIMTVNTDDINSIELWCQMINNFVEPGSYRSRIFCCLKLVMASGEKKNVFEESF